MFASRCIYPRSSLVQREGVEPSCRKAADSKSAASASSAISGLYNSYMIKLFSSQDFNIAKSKDRLNLKCEHCRNPFLAPKNEIQKFEAGHPRVRLRFCSIKCMNLAKWTSIHLKCKQCQKDFLRQKCHVGRNNFCSKSCAGKYNAAHKKFGTRRSKLEKWIAKNLKTSYPTLSIEFNKSKAINAELDIFFPLLKLAFELNGILHYKPIFGENKFLQIQNKDKAKEIACRAKGIDLLVIDTSKQNQFSPESSSCFLDQVKKAINQKLG